MFTEVPSNGGQSTPEEQEPGFDPPNDNNTSSCFSIDTHINKPMNCVTPVPLHITTDAPHALQIGPCEFQHALNDIWPHVTPEARSLNHPDLVLYEKVRSWSLPNYLGAKIPINSKFNLPMWRHELATYSDPDIPIFLEYGWPSSYTRPEFPHPSPSNHPDAITNIAHVDTFVEKEVGMGTLMGPFDCDPMTPYCKTSPIMTREKKNSLSRRIIVDLSHPYQYSVNSGILKSWFQGQSMQYTLPSVTSLLNLVQEAGSGCYIWTADLERAYRQLQVDPIDFPLSGKFHV